MPQRQTLHGPNLNRAITGDVAIVDRETRTFTLSWASDDVSVLRRSYFDEPWLETLGLDPEEVDLSRFESGSAPLLWGHDQFDRNSNVGVIEKAWLKNGRGYAQCRLSMRADLDGLWRDIEDKIITNVSAGYQVQERTLVKKNENGPSEYRVTRWLPLEISLVSVPADDTVGVGRAADASARFTVADINPQEERSMPQTAVDTPAPPANPAPQPTPVAPAPATDTRSALDITNQAIEQERTRTADIREIAKRAALADDVVDKAIRTGETVEAFRAAAFEEMAKREVQHRPQFSAGADAIDKQRKAATDWLLARSGTPVDGKPVDLNGNDYRGMTLIDLARDRLAAAGESTRGLDHMEIAKRAIAHSTSDFAVLLGNVFNKVLLAAYGVIPDTWRSFAKVGTVSDFRESQRYRAGTFGDLDTIPEGGEYKYGTISDGEANPISAKTKGKMFSVTRQLLINDDLGALTNILQLMGRGAARTIEKDVYALLALNSGLGPVMADGKTLFHADHGNLASSGAAPDIATIAAMSQAMQTQTFGGDYIDVPPSLFLGPLAIAEQVKVLNASQYDPESNKFQKPNQVRGLFSTIVGTPRLTGNAWYMFADKDAEPVIEVAFLNGVQTPYTEQREGWNVDGIEYKVRMDYGVGAVGYRGARRNPGA